MTQVVESRLLRPEAVTIDQKCIHEVLPRVQHVYARFVAQRRHTFLVDSFSLESEKELQAVLLF